MSCCCCFRAVLFALVSSWAYVPALHADSKSPLVPPHGGRARGDARISDDEIRVHAHQLPRRLPVDIRIDDATDLRVSVLRTETGAGGQLNVRWRERDGLPLGETFTRAFVGRGVEIVSVADGSVLLEGQFPSRRDDDDDDGDDEDDDDDNDDDDDDDDDDRDDGSDDDHDPGDKLVVEFPLSATGAEPRIHGTAKFESEASDDELDVETEIEIEHGTPGADYLVQITRPRPEDVIPFRATLTPDQVVPPPADAPVAAGGVGRFSFDAAGSELSFLVELSGLSSPEVATRIHLGAPGENGLAIATLDEGRQKEGTIVLGDFAATQLRAGNLYVNVETENQPAGELRGQILPVEPETERIAVLRADGRGNAKYKASGSGGLPFDAVSVKELIGSRVDVFRFAGERRILVLSGVVPDVSPGPGDVPSGHRIRVEPRSLLFGEVFVGEERSLRLRVTNTGTKKLNVVKVELETGTTPEFSIHGFEHVHLAPGASLTLRITYAPVDGGFDEGALVVRSNAQFANKVTVPLAGSGIREREPNIDVAPRVLPFGEVLVGSSRTLETTVTNVGSSDLQVSRVGFAEGSSPEFAIEGSSTGAAVAPVTLAPGASFTVAVVYTPDGAGESAGTLVIVSDDLDEPIVRVVLEGVGVPTPGPEIEVSPVALSFDDVLVGNASTLATTVRNAGTGDLVIEDITLGPESSLDYAVVTEPRSFVLSAGASASIEVRYMPAGEGFDSGTVVIGNSDADEPLVVVSLAGRGVMIETPEIDVSPLALRFGEVFVGSSRTLEVTVANAGSTNLEVTGVQFGAGSSPDFTFARDIDSVSLAPGANVVVPVRFLPGDEGAAAGTLVISSEDAEDPTVVIALSGTGIVRVLPAIRVSPASVNFGARTIGSINVRTVTIRNTGSSPLEVSSIDLRPFSSRAFSLVGTPAPVTLPAGASTQAQVRYRPERQGSDSGSLAIVSDDPLAPEVVVSLLGMGLPDLVAQLEVSPLAVDFGAVPMGGASARTVTISSTGTAELELSRIELGPGTSSSFEIRSGAQSMTLDPGAETTVDVAYDPDDSGADSGTLRLFESPGNDVPTVTVSLFGAAIRTSEMAFRRGDVDANRRLNLIDALLIGDFLFGGNTQVTCLKASDSNDDGTVDITDLVYVLNHLFTGAPPPPAPHGECGTDPSPDSLPCAAYAACSG